MAGKQSKIEIILSAKDTGIKAAFTRAQAQAAVFGKSINSISTPFKTVTSAAVSLSTTLAGIAAVAGVGLGAVASSLIKAGQGIDSLNLSYRAIFGSSQNAAKEMQFVQQTADTLGIDLLTAAQAYKQLSAASMGTALAGKQTQAIFTAVAKASTTLGLSADETSGALLAIGQMISKGKVSAEELRGQLGERLPGAFQVAAKAMGMTTAELDKALSNGEVYADDFLPKFAVALEQRFAGSAAKAATGFSAAANRINSEFDKIRAAAGQAVTNNQFFVAALEKVSGGLKGLSTDASQNAASWRQWAKESALSVLEFVADSADGFNSVYKFLSGLAGTLKLAYGGALTLGKGFQWLFEQANRLAGDSDKAAYWAQAQVESTRLIESAMNGAAQSFQNAEQGSTTLTKAAEKVRALREELGKVEAKEVIPADDVKTTTEEIVKIGGVWKNVTKDIKSSNAETTKEVNVDWGKVWSDVEKNGVSTAKAVDDALDKATRAREAVITVRKVETNQLGGLIGAFRNGGAIGALQALATGGGVRNILSGGRLAGYGGGDRRLLLGEDGEFMIRKEAVSRYGARLFAALNNMQVPQLPGFAMGGQLGAPAAATSGYTATFQFTDQSGQVGRVYGQEIDIRRLESAVARANRYRSSNR